MVNLFKINEKGSQVGDDASDWVVSFIEFLGHADILIDRLVAGVDCLSNYYYIGIEIA